MKTIGETLKTIREKQRRSIEDIAEQTFIRPEYIRAIEANEFHTLPSVASVYGFIRTYAKLLGIEPKTALALLRRDFDTTPQQILPTFTSVQSRNKQWVSRVKFVTMIVASILVVGGYGFWSLMRLRQPPPLTIFVPKDGTKVNSTVVVKGITSSDAVVEIDAQPVALTQDGEFARELTLTNGEHTITVTAKNRQQQATTQQITVDVRQ